MNFQSHFKLKVELNHLITLLIYITRCECCKILDRCDYEEEEESRGHVDLTRALKNVLGRMNVWSGFYDKFSATSYQVALHAKFCKSEPYYRYHIPRIYDLVEDRKFQVSECEKLEIAEHLGETQQ